MQLHNMSWIEVQFLKKAVDILCQCRQTLMYTYVFAFYLRKNNQSIIFEVRMSSRLANIHINCDSTFRSSLEHSSELQLPKLLTILEAILASI